MLYDSIVIGGGPAGLTAAVYLRRAGKTVLIIEKNTFGGQITWSPRVENFPGFVSVSGTELGDLMTNQAMDQGAEVELEEVCAISEGEGCKVVKCLSGAEFTARTVILATGARPAPLGVSREEELTGSGINYCAVCDGAFYAGAPVAVVGGGNSALQDAMLLSETSSRVYLIHRRDSFRGEQKLADALAQKENVELILNAKVMELLGDEELSGVVVEQDGKLRTLNVDGVFVAVGHRPDLAPFGDYVALDERGYADADESCRTRTPGIFVAGDCRRKGVRQLTTAVADGAVAALAAVSFLDAM